MSRVFDDVLAAARCEAGDDLAIRLANECRIQAVNPYGESEAELEK